MPFKVIQDHRGQ